jgi:hypothetical protein
MYILRLPWSKLNEVQREDVLNRFKPTLNDVTASPRLYKHHIYAMTFRIHPKTGDVLFF